MAFRKSVRSHYASPPFAHGFGEVKFEPGASSGSARYLSRSFIPPEELADSALPLFSLDDVIKSGQVIDGTVSFGPSDPALIGARVNSALTSYIETHPVTPSSDEN